MSKNDKHEFDMVTRAGITKLVIGLLCEMCESDPAALRSLLQASAPCRKELLDHPLLQVSRTGEPPEEVYTMSVLSLINGIVERLTGVRIAAVHTQNSVDGEGRLTGFIPYQPDAFSDRHPYGYPVQQQAGPDSFKPSKRWHMGLQEWVLPMEPQTKEVINVWRWNGVVHAVNVHQLCVDKPNPT